MFFLLSFRLNLLLFYFSWKTLFSHRGKCVKHFILIFIFHVLLLSLASCDDDIYLCFVDDAAQKCKRDFSSRKTSELEKITRSRVSGMQLFILPFYNFKSKHVSFQAFLQLRNKWTRVKSCPMSNLWKLKLHIWELEAHCLFLFYNSIFLENKTKGRVASFLQTIQLRKS